MQGPAAVRIGGVSPETRARAAGQRSIRSWMLLVSLVAVLPMLALLLGVTAWGLQQQAQQREASLQRQTARAAEAVDAQIALHLARLELVAAGVAARRGLLEPLHEVLVALDSLDDGIVAASLVDTTGRRLVDSRIPRGEPLPPSGTPDWDRLVLESGRPSVSPLVVGTVAREPVIGLGVPVLGPTGERTGVLRVALAARGLSDRLARVPVPEGWVVAVIDRSGVIVARSVEPGRFVGQRATDSALALIASGPGHVQHAITKDGRAALAATAPVGNTGWHLVIGAPEDSIERGQARALLGVLLAGLAVAGLSAALSVRLGRRVADSVRAVAAGGLGDAAADGAAIRELVHIRARFDDHEDAAQAQARQLRSARLDTLTGLPARGLFNDEAARRLATLRPGQALGLLFIDLDGFKALNDRLGHEAGDRALTATGALLRQLLRPEDLAARLGGDEFVVALVAPEAQLRASCEQVAQRLVAGLPAAVPGLGCSIGITLAAPGEALASVLARADEAMLTAKRSGKGRVEFG